MPKASEIARARTTAADSNKWLAAIVGLVGAMFCAIVAVVAMPATWGFFALLGVGVASVVVPSAIALRAMRGSSAEFKAAWIAVLAAMLALWVAGGGWLKRTAGVETALREIEAAERDADREKADLDAGRRPHARPRPEAIDSRNGFAHALSAFRQHDWRSVENYRRYTTALDAVDWTSMSDPAKTGPATQHAAKDARYVAGLAAVDAWYAAERDSLKTLRADIAALALPDPLGAHLTRRLDAMDYATRVQAYSESQLLERARQATAVLDAGPWSREAGKLRFADFDNEIAYYKASFELKRAIDNRASVRRQLHGTAASDR